MVCKVCKSDNLRALDGDLTLSRPDLNGLKTSPVYVCQSVLICLDCGFSELVVPEDKLSLLGDRTSAAGG